MSEFLNCQKLIYFRILKLNAKIMYPFSVDSMYGNSIHTLQNPYDLKIPTEPIAKCNHLMANRHDIVVN